MFHKTMARQIFCVIDTRDHMPTPAASPIVRPRICFLGYRQIAVLAEPVLAEYAHRAEIEVVEGAFDKALAYARERIQRGTADVFMSAGANGAILRKNLAAPVAIIQLDGFSLMQALLKARAISARVGVVTYGRTIPELDDVKGILKLEVAQYAYETTDDARRCCERLRQDGFAVIVGSSVVVEIAEGQGLHGLLAYSLNGIRRGLEDAIELARVSRLESGRYQQLNAVLGNLQEAVLAVDRRHSVIAINSRMQQLLNNSDDSPLGKRLDSIAPELSLERTMESGVEQRAAVLRFARRDWIVNRTPIREYGEIVGTCITASTRCAWLCRRCANVPTTSPRWRARWLRVRWRGSAANSMPKPRWRLCCRCWPPTTGRAMSANSKISQTGSPCMFCSSPTLTASTTTGCATIARSCSPPECRLTARRATPGRACCKSLRSATATARSRPTSSASAVRRCGDG